MDAKFCAANKRSASLAGSEAAVYVKSSQASFLQTSFWRAVSSVSGLANELGVYKLQAEARHQTVLETGPVFALASVHARSWRVQPRPRCVCSLQCSYCATLVWTVAANKWLVHNQPASKGSARVAHASSQRPQRGHAPPSAKAPPAGQLSKFHLTSFSPTDQTCAKQVGHRGRRLAPAGRGQSWSCRASKAVPRLAGSLPVPWVVREGGGRPRTYRHCLVRALAAPPIRIACNFRTVHPWHRWPSSACCLLLSSSPPHSPPAQRPPHAAAQASLAPAATR